MTGVRIPAARLTPLIREWLDEYSRTHHRDAGHTGAHQSGIPILAQRAGISEERIKKLRDGNRGYAIVFDTAERLLAAIGRLPDAWYAELADLYPRPASGSALIRQGNRKCRRGHRFNDANTYVYTDRNGYRIRQCRACKRDDMRARRSRQEAPE